MSAAAKDPRQTFGAAFGELCLLVSQSLGHRDLPFKTAEWLLLPPLTLGQFRFFRQDDRPLGVALWAFLDEEGEKALLADAPSLRPIQWRAKGPWSAQIWALEAQVHAHARDDAAAQAAFEKAKTATQSLADTAEPEGQLWLVELIAPFSNAENLQRERILADLMQQPPFKGRAAKTMKIAKDGEKSVANLEG